MDPSNTPSGSGAAPAEAKKRGRPRKKPLPTSADDKENKDQSAKPPPKTRRFDEEDDEEKASTSKAAERGRTPAARNVEGPKTPRAARGKTEERGAQAAVARGVTPMRGKKERTVDPEARGKKAKRTVRARTEDREAAKCKRGGRSQTSEPSTAAVIKTAEPVYNMTAPKRIEADPEIDVEVEAGLGLPVQASIDQVARELAEAAGKEGGGGDQHWPVDYIVAATGHKRNRLVVKYTGYARPSLTSIPKKFVPSTPEYVDFWQREETMNHVERFIRAEVGGEAQFAQQFPARYATEEPGVSESEFVEDSWTLYIHRLRAYEWRFNFQTRKVNKPPVLFANWTGEITEMPKFQYTHLLRPSQKVRHAQARSDDYGHIKCKGACAEGGHACQSALLIGERKRTCECAVKQKRGGAERVDPSPVECTDECECDPRECGNRLIQRGRQRPLLVFYSREKGWTVRALTPFARGDFVGEYVGEVLTDYESKLREDHSYHMAMPNVREKDEALDSKKKTHSKLVIDGLEWGNETRFIAHSCEPNLGLVASYVERYGGWYVRMPFITKKPIAVGEEMTFDYFPDVRFDGCAHYNQLFPDCRCGSARCKFRVPLCEDAKRERAEALDGTKRARERAQALKDGDSFSEGSDSECAEAREKKKLKQKMDRSERNRIRAKRFMSPLAQIPLPQQQVLQPLQQVQQVQQPMVQPMMVPVQPIVQPVQQPLPESDSDSDNDEDAHSDRSEEL